MRILVTGTEGYLGSLLAPELSRRGHDVTGWTPVSSRTAGCTAVPIGRSTPLIRMSGRSPGASGRFRRGRAHGRTVERSARRPTRRAHLRGQPQGHRPAGHAGQGRRSPAVHPHVFVQRLRRRGWRRRRELAGQPADCLRRLQGVGGAGRLGSGGRRLLADLHAQRDRLRSLAAHAVRHRAEQPERLGAHHPPDLHDLRRHPVATAGARAWTSARQFVALCEAPREIVHNEVFNVGSNEQNYQVREIAETVAAAFPGCVTEFGAPGPDNRSYRVNFDKIHAQLPGFCCDWDAATRRRAIGRDLQLDRSGPRDVHRPRTHPAQPARVPAADEAGRRRTDVDGRRHEVHPRLPSTASRSSTSSRTATIAASSPAASARTSSSTTACCRWLRSATSPTTTSPARCAACTISLPPATEAKLVRCIAGAIVDQIVDLRPESPTYLQHVSVELTAANRRSLYVPPMFAHGYQTLVDDAEVLYQVSERYTPGQERGLRYDDPAARPGVAASGDRDQRQGRVLAASRSATGHRHDPRRHGAGPVRQQRGPADPGRHDRRRIHGPRRRAPDHQVHAGHGAGRGRPTVTSAGAERAYREAGVDRRSRCRFGRRGDCAVAAGEPAVTDDPMASAQPTAST